MQSLDFIHGDCKHRVLSKNFSYSNGQQVKSEMHEITKVVYLKNCAITHERYPLFSAAGAGISALGAGAHSFIPIAQNLKDAVDAFNIGFESRLTDSNSIY